MPTAPHSNSKRPASHSGKHGAARSAASGATGAEDAITLLKQDHREVEGYFDQYEKLDDDSDKADLAQEICLALKVHTQIEEELFYPEAREATEDDDLVDEATVEHASAKQLIAEIESMKVGDDLYDAKIKILGEYVKHHVKEEEQELFPEVKKSKMDTAGLGEQMADRKEQLMAEMGKAGAGRRA